MTRLARRTALAGTAAGALAAPFVARADGPVRWRMATAWPPDLPGPGVSARRITERVAAMSGGRLQIELFAAGELVPAFEVLDAVSRGTAEIGHAAAVFWSGKLRASPFFLAVPFGLVPHEHDAWIYQGGGQALYDRYYADLGVKPYLAGNTGMSMAGWFRRELTGPEDLDGLRFRMPGFGGRMYQQLGVVQVSLPPGETLTALQSGAIDAAEFAGPASDLALGFHRAARRYYWPGIHEPNGSGEALVNRKALDRLPADLRAIVEHACATENAIALGEAERRNTAALAKLTGELGVRLRELPATIVNRARAAADDLYADFANRSGIEGEIARSYRDFRDREGTWSRISMHAFLGARATS
ncbi:MAG: ABC transporter substrate-binding protein [Alphaproteobacteria bacterium]|jgi:TRAP-type mannitol/chloroaromatic compound transport system substrate-binding protein|nr:ABC transporter substrate-binding protein [Alphaproteobacteria bacterium]